jgi:CYTH domain-containing protein
MDITQEIERKYLLAVLPEINYDCIIRIHQLYKLNKPERIRQEDLYAQPRKPLENFWLKDPQTSYTHTLKESVQDQEGLRETNKTLQQSEFNELLPKFPNHIHKLRHVKSCKLNGGLKWEIDDFSCHSTERLKFVIAEIEVPSLNYEVKFPEWLKQFVLMEVTNKSEFSNFKLSQLI